MSVDAEGASIRSRRDGKDNYVKNSVDGDLIDNSLVLEGQVHGHARPPAISTTEYRQGSHSLMFQVLPNNRGKERSELWFEGSRTGRKSRRKPFDPSFTGGSRTSVIPWGEERYTAFSFKLPTDYQVGSGLFITQFWQVSPKGPPASLLLYRKDGRLKGTLQILNDRGMQIVDRFTVKRGVWHDVILNYKFSLNPSEGFMQAWVRPVTNKQYRRLKRYQGAIGFTSNSKRRSKGLFHKFGIYRPGKDSRKQTVFFDEVRNARPSPNIFYELDPSFINPRQFYVLKNLGANAALSVPNSSQTITSGSSAILSAASRRGWQFIYVEDGYYQLLSSGKALEAKQGSSQTWNDGDPVQLTDRTDQPSQHWYLIDQGKGNYQIINRASRLSLAGSPGTSDGQLVQLARPTTQAPQLWRFGS
ncbi:hypothetical protein C1752_12985 [Acaryochloris thomasi RCC1774]|uniref:Ricin B lectin domain-containing protein n=2 Tax=Acaryochloris TaxID=155977 RepID=A0A2W1JMC8_9CYAN|nr:hypothetical protein C1752_12985 [Acaryochloris thomasi RCC1774]